MRSTTHVWLGANNVGMPDDSYGVWSGTFTEVILCLSQWLGPRSMAARFDLVIGRSEEEVRGALKMRESRTHGIGGDELTQSIAKMMETSDGVD